MTSSWYDAFAQEIRKAGFFTNGVQQCGTWERTCVASKRRAGGKGYSGNSFWVTLLPDGWYFGTWGYQIYRLPKSEDIIGLCVSWLSRVPNETRYLFDQELIEQFGLLLISEDEFERATGDRTA